eukprot:TRINITY_DN4636_c0_g3_i1.p1 TRINITY_DN4636_c0_g3~~TRINITY_DN4636_c0_g3_i1.p1  ORF type:complete len:442 (+),score=139.92 TRINITY_DN4636_c0_g3_i1:61-1326(+)
MAAPFVYPPGFGPPPTDPPPSYESLFGPPGCEFNDLELSIMEKTTPGIVITPIHTDQQALLAAHEVSRMLGKPVGRILVMASHALAHLDVASIEDQNTAVARRALEFQGGMLEMRTRLSVFGTEALMRAQRLKQQRLQLAAAGAKTPEQTRSDTLAAVVAAAASRPASLAATVPDPPKKARKLSKKDISVSSVSTTGSSTPSNLSHDARKRRRREKKRRKKEKRAAKKQQLMIDRGLIERPAPKVVEATEDQVLVLAGKDGKPDRCCRCRVDLPKDIPDYCPECEAPLREGLQPKQPTFPAAGMPGMPGGLMPGMPGMPGPGFRMPFPPPGVSTPPPHLRKGPVGPGFTRSRSRDARSRRRRHSPSSASRHRRRRRDSKDRDRDRDRDRRRGSRDRRRRRSRSRSDSYEDRGRRRRRSGSR